MSIEIYFPKAWCIWFTFRGVLLEKVAHDLLKPSKLIFVHCKVTYTMPDVVPLVDKGACPFPLERDAARTVASHLC